MPAATNNNKKRMPSVQFDSWKAHAKSSIDPPEHSSSHTIKKTPSKSRISSYRQKDVTEVEEGFVRLKTEVKEYKSHYIAFFICNLCVCFFVTGMFPQYLRKVLGLQDTFYIANIFKYSFSVFGMFVFLLLMIILFLAEHSYIKSIAKDYITDDKRNYDISKKKVYGSAEFQKEDERKECWYMERDITKIPGHGDVVGYDDDGKIYSLRTDLHGLNKNKTAFGAPGSGKSAAIVINDVYQNIARGDSMVITDSKGDLYKQLAHVLKKHGYIIKILNLKSSELQNSDACDFFKIVKDAPDADVKAMTLANAIIKNTEDAAHLDYWAKNEMNYLKALILHISNPNHLSYDGDRTLPGLYHYSSTHTLNEIAAEFQMLPENDPARQAFNTFRVCDPKVQGQIANGMNIRLQSLGNEMMKHVAGDDEIDLLLPMQKKCCYFVVISDTDTTFKFVATLFFTELFMKLCDYSDSLTKEEKRDQLPVNFILDEFANTGVIPEYDKKVATVRSRKIGITMILQDVGQLEYMYPNKIWNSILNDMSMKILLSTNDPNTAKYFSGLLGVQTVRIENRKYNQTAGEVVNAHAGYGVTEGLGKRELMTPDELMNDLSSDDLIVHISGRHPVMLHKFISTNHPMDKERFEKRKIKKVNKKTGEIRIFTEEREVETIPANHIPQWQINLRDQLENEEEERNRMLNPDNKGSDHKNNTKPKNENKQDTQNTGKAQSAESDDYENAPVIGLNGNTINQKKPKAVKPKRPQGKPTAPAAGKEDKPKRPPVPEPPIEEPEIEDAYPEMPFSDEDILSGTSYEQTEPEPEEPEEPDMPEEPENEGIYEDEDTSHMMSFFGSGVSI